VTISFVVSGGSFYVTCIFASVDHRVRRAL